MLAPVRLRTECTECRDEMLVENKLAQERMYQLYILSMGRCHSVPLNENIDGTAGHATTHVSCA